MEENIEGVEMIDWNIVLSVGISLLIVGTFVVGAGLYFWNKRTKNDLESDIEGILEKKLQPLTTEIKVVEGIVGKQLSKFQED